MFLKIKIWEIINVAFLNLKKVVKDRALPIQPQKLVKEKKNPPPSPKKCQKLAKSVYYALFFVLCGRLGDPYERPGD